MTSQLKRISLRFMLLGVLAGGLLFASDSQGAAAPYCDGVYAACIQNNCPPPEMTPGCLADCNYERDLCNIIYN